MRCYHFHLRDHGAVHRDFDGTDLPDLQAARAHGLAVAEELMRCSSFRSRHCSLFVENGRGERQFELFFSEVDPEVAAYSPQMRAVVHETCRQISALTDVLAATRATCTQSCMLMARAKHRPYLVYARGE